MKVISSLLIAFACTASCNLVAQPEVSVNLNVKRSIDGLSTFDRSKYIVMHSMLTTTDWKGEEDKLDYLLNDLDVYFGRDNGSMPYYATQVEQNPNNLGYASPESIAAYGKTAREDYYGKTLSKLHKYDNRAHVMIGGQINQFWIGNHKGKGEWSFANTDAVGQYMGNFVNEFYRNDNQGPNKGPARPQYLEILNEPLYELVDVHHGKPIDTFIFHNEVAQGIRKVNTSIKIGGFTTAFPWFDDNNFNRWDERMKLFLDTSGEYMDYFSIHLYDFGYLNRDKGVANFKGARIEATMDMMEQYEKLKLGKVKPFMISEYGGRDHKTEATPWTAINDWQTMKSFSPMMMQFMAKPNLILKAIPFSLAKAEWSGNEGRDYAWRLLRHNDEKTGETGDEYVFTDIIKFYQLWSDVNGTRVNTESNEADLLVDSYVNNNKAYVIISNLETSANSALLNLIELPSNPINNIKIKHLHFANGEPTLTTTSQNIGVKNELPKSINIGAEATVIIEYTFSDNIKIIAESDEHKYYATTYKQAIKANTALKFNINEVKISEYGKGILRLSFGREHDLAQQPIVKVNDTLVTVPTDYAGDEQVFRPQVFSMLEIEVPNELLKTNNTILVTYPDDGGFVSSVTLQAFEYSDDI